MIDQIKIGCASTKTIYGERLDTALIELNPDAKISGLFTSNKFKSAPVQICLKQLKKKMKGKLHMLHILEAKGGGDMSFLKTLKTIEKQHYEQLKTKKLSNPNTTKKAKTKKRK